VKDLMATPIALATGERNNVNKFTQYPWFYSPLVFPSEKHPISTNVDGVKFEFANGIELLKNDIKKQVLLASSPYSKNIGAPVAVTLEMVEERPEPAIFKNTGLIPMAVLLEGSFHSMYENRVLPFKDSRYKKKGNFNKMIVISDGDVIKNQFDKNYQPLELGYDKWTNKFYGNKEFLMNCVNYLLDDDGLINIRNKEVSMALLDREKVYSNFTQIELLSIVIPLAILIVFGLIFYYWRKKKFAT
jgi:gliding-associated putative ABC transporter substrate-binding component GldG